MFLDTGSTIIEELLATELIESRDSLYSMTLIEFKTREFC